MVPHIVRRSLKMVKHGCCELSIVENQRQFTTGQQQGLCARASEKMAAIVPADIVTADIWGREKPNVTLGSDYEMNRANDKD